MPWWSELSDDELRARLVHRGVFPAIAVELVENRDDLPQSISELLKGDD